MNIENANTIRRASRVFTGDPLLKLNIQVPAVSRSEKYHLTPNWLIKNVAKLTTRTFTLLPVSMGNMYRMAVNGSNIGMITSLPKIGDPNYNRSVNLLSHTAALLLSNSEDMPSDDMIEFIESNFTFAQIQSITIAAVVDAGVNDIYKFYGLIENAAVSVVAKDSDYLQHRSIGQMLVYFKGAFTELELKWKLTWNNYLLYLAAIGVPDDERTTALATGSMSDVRELQPDQWC